jgi:XTP/dITP diphosphohydrolase
MTRIDLVLATRNRAKRRELVTLLGPLPGARIRSLDEYPDIPSPEEVGDTFEANAVLKALHAAEATGGLALADDSGLVVDALGGAPGVRSARYAGEQATDAANNARLLRALARVSRRERTARFVCCVAIAQPWGLLTLVRGECRGIVATGVHGSHGFGYDPLVYLPRYGKTFGQLPAAVKHRLSHRSRAMAQARRYLLTYLRRYCARGSGSRRSAARPGG